jgi:hemerythrin-like domain-containing protein
LYVFLLEVKMKAIQVLMEEHRVIERVLATLDTAAQYLEDGQDFRPGFFLEATDFIQGFADKWHHNKEEGVLFKIMVENGVPNQGGPIGVMLFEHDQGRRFTRGIREAAVRYEAGDTTSRSDIIQNIRQYTALLRQHIQKEDTILYPMAETAIPASQHLKVLEDFDHVELEEASEGLHVKYLALAKSLEAEISNTGDPA